MFLGGHFIGGDFLVDSFGERHRCDIGDGIGLADQPAGGLQGLLHPVQQQGHQSGPGGVAFFLGIGLARHPQPGFLALLAGDFLQHFGQFFVGELLRRLLQMVAPVEDDEVVDQPVDVPDPVAHQRPLIRRIRAQRWIGIGLVEIFADGAAFMQRLAVVDQRRDHAVRIDLEIFRRMMLQPRHVDDMAFVGEALFLEDRAEPGARRSSASRGEGRS